MLINAMFQIWMLVPHDRDPRRQPGDFVQHSMLRASQHAEIELPDAPSPPIETVFKGMPAMNEVDEAAGPCPGGPEDESVLISFRMHIAASIWRQQVFFLLLSY